MILFCRASVTTIDLISMVSSLFTYHSDANEIIDLLSKNNL